MFIGQSPDCLEFNNELLADHQVGDKFSEWTPVFILNCNWHLLLDAKTLLTESIAQGVFVIFLIVSVTEEGVGFEGRLTNAVG